MAYAKMAAQELARWDIRVNVICPGAIKTNIGERTYTRNLEKVRWDIRMPGRGIGPGGANDAGTLQRFPPLYGRSAEASEVADLVLFLASEESRYITGAEIVIDAGLTLLRG